MESWVEDWELNLDFNYNAYYYWILYAAILLRFWKISKSLQSLNRSVMRQVTTILLNN